MYILFYHGSVSSRTLTIALTSFNFKLSGGCIVISHCAFNSYFSDN